MTVNKAVLAIITFGIISTLLIFWFIPNIETWIQNQPIWVYFIFFYFIIFALVSSALWFVLHNRLQTFRIASTTTLIIMAIDLILPSYAVDWQGNLQSSNTIGYFGSIDFVSASFWSYLGVNGILLAFFTYVVTGMILLFVALWMMGKTKFILELKRIII